MLREFEHGLPQDENSTYALDSGAHPSHVKHPSRTMRKLHIPIPTHTATNSKTNATHYGHVQIQTSNYATMTLPAVANPALKKEPVICQRHCEAMGKSNFLREAGCHLQHITPVTATVHRNGHIEARDVHPRQTPKTNPCTHSQFLQ